MKKTLISVLLAVCLIFTFMLTACNNNNGGENPPVTPPEESEVNIDSDFTVTSNILVVYFSKTNTTESVALKIQELTNADIFEVERKEPYPEAYTPTTEVAKDENDANARPELKAYLPKDVMANYDTVFVGFPIWWHTAPMPILSFLNFYDFSGKTIYTFCTAASSPITESTADIRSNAQGATVVEGRKFSRNDSGIESWVNSLNLAQKPNLPDQPEIPTEPTASLTYERNGNEYTVTGETANEKNIVIPTEYEGLPVTTIKESAFAYSRHTADIVSVTIPDSVTTIERNAFYNRDEMTNVYISADSRLTTIDNNAFSGNHSLEFIYIPSGVSKIGDSAFNNCGAINFAVSADNGVYRSDNGHLIETSIRTLIRGGQNDEIPAWITNIAQAAFRRSALTELSIPATIITIGNYIIANSSIAVINFAGTEEQWNAVQKGTLWNSGNRNIEVKFDGGEPKILIVYFTAESGNTERLANYIHGKIGGDVVKIEAAQPYTAQELNYSIQNNRPEVEKAENARPDIAAATYNAIDMSKYDTVFIGYPIWWWTAPMIIGTFLEHYDLTDIDIYPFSQSASMNTTHFTTSMEFVRESAAKSGTPTVHDGLFARASNTSTIDNYLRTNGFIA